MVCCNRFQKYIELFVQFPRYQLIQKFREKYLSPIAAPSLGVVRRCRAVVGVGRSLKNRKFFNMSETETKKDLGNGKADAEDVKGTKRAAEVSRTFGWSAFASGRHLPVTCMSVVLYSW